MVKDIVRDVELYVCESKACPSYESEVEHEVLIINEFEAKYRVLICPKCGLRTFRVLKYNPQFMDEKPPGSGE